MQPPKFKTSPTLDAIDPKFYGIKGSMYPEDGRMLRVIEWFKRLEGFKYVDIVNSRCACTEECDEHKWKDGKPEVWFKPTKTIADNLPYDKLDECEIAIETDLFPCLVVPAGNGVGTMFGGDFEGYDYPIANGFDIDNCYTRPYQESEDLRHVACITRVFEDDIHYGLDIYIGDHSTHLEPDETNCRNAVYLDVAGYRVEVYEENTLADVTTFIRLDNPVEPTVFESIVTSIKLAFALHRGIYINESTFYFCINERGGITGMMFHHGYDTVTGWGRWSLDYPDNIDAVAYLGRLATYMYQNPALYETVILIAKTVHLRGFSKGCMASVILEKVTKFLRGGETVQTESIIPEVDTRKAIKKDLQKALKGHKAEIEKDIFEKLTSKIGSIDQQTNAGKLSNPFEQFGIELSETDRLCIDCRNDFLHGVYPKVKIEEFKEKNREDYADTVATRILELTAKLIVEAAVRG